MTTQMTQPTILAYAEFTADMVETLSTYFERYEIDGVVVVEVTSHGLWLPNPNAMTRQFLGLARLSDKTGPVLPPHGH